MTIALIEYPETLTEQLVSGEGETISDKHTHPSKTKGIVINYPVYLPGFSFNEISYLWPGVAVIIHLLGAFLHGEI